MAPNVRRSDPPYMQIAEDIRRRIRSGQLRDGDLVPSTRQLAREWGVSVPTAAKALMTLRAEGYVRGVAGTGTIVSAGTTTHHPGEDRLQAIEQTGRIYPPNEHAVIRSAELVPAPDAIADALGLDPGAEVIRRHRVTYRDEAPVSASTSWLPGELAGAAPRLLATERITPGTSSKRPDGPSCEALTRSPPGRQPRKMLPTSACLPARPWHAPVTGGMTVRAMSSNTASASQSRDAGHRTGTGSVGTAAE